MRTPRRLPRRASVATVRFWRPASMRWTYRAESLTFSASCSWVRPRAVRSSATRNPIACRRRISSLTVGTHPRLRPLGRPTNTTRYDVLAVRAIPRLMRRMAVASLGLLTYLAAFAAAIPAAAPAPHSPYCIQVDCPSLRLKSACWSESSGETVVLRYVARAGCTVR